MNLLAFCCLLLLFLAIEDTAYSDLDGYAGGGRTGERGGKKKPTPKPNKPKPRTPMPTPKTTPKTTQMPTPKTTPSPVEDHGNENKVTVCHRNQEEQIFETLLIEEEAWPEHEALGALLGPCNEEKCALLCSAAEEDYCKTRVVLDDDNDSCSCALWEVDAGLQCCGLLGSLAPVDKCCPVGWSICCGLSMVECVQALDPCADSDDPCCSCPTDSFCLDDSCVDLSMIQSLPTFAGEVYREVFTAPEEGIEFMVVGIPGSVIVFFPGVVLFQFFPDYLSVAFFYLNIAFGIQDDDIVVAAPSFLGSGGSPTLSRRNLQAAQCSQADYLLNFCTQNGAAYFALDKAGGIKFIDPGNRPGSQEILESSLNDASSKYRDVILGIISAPGAIIGEAFNKIITLNGITITHALMCTDAKIQKSSEVSACCKESDNPSCCGDDDPCCGSEDPCCGLEEDCCQSEDPCCGSQDPCCGSTDKCCGITDPCCGSTDKCCGIADPCCGSSDRCCGNSDRCCRSTSACCGADNCGGGFGDPNMLTFDGLLYPCNAVGEFVLAASSNFKVHATFENLSARFLGNQGNATTFVTAVAVVVDGAPPVQLYFDELDAEPKTLLVDGVITDLLNGYEDAELSVVLNPPWIRIWYKSSDLRVVVKDRSLFLDVAVSLPDAFLVQSIRGLLGSPDQNSFNDWTSSSTGEVLPLPPGDLYGIESYNYCTSEWCITDPASSIIAYRPGVSFEDVENCDRPYQPLDFSRASPELRQLCGENPACLADGIYLGIGDAQTMLGYGLESALKRAAASTLFVDPAIIPVGVSMTVEFTVDARELSQDIQYFRVYELNQDGENEITVVYLDDRGSGIGSDIVADDSVFSNMYSFRATVAGKETKFRAVAVINNVEESTLSFPASVTSFSDASGFVNGISPPTAGLLSFPLLDDLRLRLELSWATYFAADMDFAVSFLGTTASSVCGPFPYPMYLGYQGFYSDTAEYNWFVLIGDALNDGAWTNTATIDLYAGWQIFPGDLHYGPSTLKIFVEGIDEETGTQVIVDTAVLVTDPGVARENDSCTDTIFPLASVSLTYNGVSVSMQVASFPNPAA